MGALVGPLSHDMDGRSARVSERAAVIDIGSNSTRLVIYDGLGRSPLVLFNEKVLCGLGRGLGSTGRLDAAGIALALPNLERFVGLARAVGVVRLDLVATAAVRDASDGVAFVQEIERRCGVRVRILAGGDEARISALGVISGLPDAKGIVGDLGGGSVELVAVSGGQTGRSDTLPLGPLRLADFADNERRLREVIDGHIAKLPWLRDHRRQEFYLVGGAWRTLAKLYMEQERYPLHVIHGYSIGRLEAQDFAEMIAHMSRKSLEKIPGVSRRRLETLPLAAHLLVRLLQELDPLRVVFSAFGLREGILYELLSREERAEEPLAAACRAVARAMPRFGIEAEDFVTWTAPLFPGERPRGEILRRAVALLSDTAWSEHPDYRAEAAFTRALHLPVPAISHPERVFIATALHARYGGSAEAEILKTTACLLQDEEMADARALGIALRLGYTLSGGAPGLLLHTGLGLEDDTLVLAVPDEKPLYLGETIQRRLEILARAMQRRAAMRPV